MGGREFLLKSRCRVCGEADGDGHLVWERSFSHVVHTRESSESACSWNLEWACAEGVDNPLGSSVGWSVDPQFDEEMAVLMPEHRVRSDGSVIWTLEVCAAGSGASSFTTTAFDHCGVMLIGWIP